MQLNYCLFFFKWESSPLNIRSQIVSPSKTATLSASLQPCTIKLFNEERLWVNKKRLYHYSNLIPKRKKERTKERKELNTRAWTIKIVEEISHTSILWKGSPIAWSMELNKVDEDEIFLWSPWTFLESVFVTTRCSSHCCCCLEPDGTDGRAVLRSEGKHVTTCQR